MLEMERESKVPTTNIHIGMRLKGGVSLLLVHKALLYLRRAVNAKTFADGFADAGHMILVVSFPLSFEIFYPTFLNFFLPRPVS